MMRRNSDGARRKSHKCISEYPENSAGDLFRLLPFEGYVGVLCFLPGTQLLSCARVSRGWRYAVGFRPRYDASMACKTLEQLRKFLTLLQQRREVSEICCDISGIADVNSDRFIGLTNERDRNMAHVTHVTWRCDFFFQYHAVFLCSRFPGLRSLTLDLMDDPFDRKKLSLYGLEHLSLGPLFWMKQSPLKVLDPVHKFRTLGEF